MSVIQSIGIFGGSFNPVHNGHVLVAKAALEELSLDRLFIVPAARSPFKPEQQPAAAEVRLRLLRLAFAGENRCELDTQELGRDGVSYSVDTLSNYAARFSKAELHYLIGADHVPTLPQWREAKRLAKLAKFVVVPRPGQPIAEFPEPFRGQALQGWPFEVSSSTIRQRLALGQAIEGLVPHPVAKALGQANPYLSE